MYKILIFLLFSSNALANFDANLGAQGRSYPGLGAEVFTQAGYNYLFWGEGKDKGPFYGLVRPSLNLSSSFVINTIHPKLEFYPISFLGISVGRENIESNYDKFNYFNCDHVRCKGTLIKDYVEFRMALGYKNIVSTGEIKTSINHYSKGNDKPVAEFRSANIVQKRNEVEYNSRYVLAHKTDFGLIGGAIEYTKFQKSNAYYKSIFALVNFKDKEMNYIVGLGTFESTKVKNGIILLIRSEFNLLKSQKLF